MLKGFKIKVKNEKILEMNDLKRDGLYPVSHMDDDTYFIILENGLNIEVPIDEAEVVETKSMMFG